MNEIIFSRKPLRSMRRNLLKDLTWTAAHSVSLGGLYVWPIEDHWVQLERIEMPLPHLGDGFDGAKLAHISDLHLSPLVRERYLANCIEIINELQVDFIAVTGDLITGNKSHARRVARILGRARPKIATLACLGNHDYGLVHPSGVGARRGLADYLAEQLTLCDVFVMLNESRIFRCGDSSVQFVGLEDFWTDRYDPALAFDTIASDVPVIALCHNPDAAAELADNPDVKEFYLGLGEAGARKRYRDVKHYKRRKRWL